MVNNNSFKERITGQTLGNGNRKGLGYNIEAFIAVLTLFIFAIGSMQTPADIQWSDFQSQVAAEDIGYVITKTGDMENFLERGETGSIQTAVNTLTDDQLQVAGNVQGLPIGEKRIGFYVDDDRITDFETQDISDLGDQCQGDLEEINSEQDIRRTTDPRDGAYLYLADTDPETPGGFDGEENYDSVWVDNGTRCQFAPEDGPFYTGEFFWWGDGDEGTHYDIDRIKDDGESITLYEADQPVRFKRTMGDHVNGIETDTRFDTFNFSTSDLSVYDVLVFPGDEALEEVNEEINGEQERVERVIDYMSDNAVLFLIDLEESDLEDGFMSRTGMEWIDLDWTEEPQGAHFPGTSNSRKTQNFFLGSEGDRDSIDMKPGGNVSSGDNRLVYTRTGWYDTNQWNATNLSVEHSNNKEDFPDGVPESNCDEYWEGKFEFPDDDYDVYGSNLHCDPDNEIWGLSINLEGEEINNDEKTIVEGDRFEVNGRTYLVRTHGPDGAEFIYIENHRIELVNHRTSFPEDSIHRFARTGYMEDYGDDNRKLVSAVIYWLAEEDDPFGPDITPSASTSLAGGVKNDVYMPYRLNLRWER